MNEQPRDPDPELGRAFYGFVASNPQPSGSGGTKRLYFKAGQEHYEYGPDGSRTKLPTTFLAIGRLQTSTNPNTGIESTEFIVSRFGHDLARMNTEIGTPRRLSQMESPNHQQPARQVAFEPPEQRQPEHEQPARAM